MSNLPVIRKQISDPKSKVQFKNALPTHIAPEKFERVALTALGQNTDLASCTPQSVMNALVKCAQDGLLPDGKEAALVKYGNTATYMPMVYGLIKKMRNSGEIQSVNAYVIYENEEFDYVIENGEQKFTHRPKLTGERGKPVAAYCTVLLKDGGCHVELMNVEEIEKARNAGKAANGPAWKNWWTEMAKKTVIHRAAKRVPTSSDIEKFMQSDMRVTLTGQSEEPEKPINSIIDNLNEEIIEGDVIEDNDGEGEQGEPQEEDVFPGDTPMKEGTAHA